MKKKLNEPLITAHTGELHYDFRTSQGIVTINGGHDRLFDTDVMVDMLDDWITQLKNFREELSGEEQFEYDEDGELVSTKEELPPVYNVYPERIFGKDDIHPSVRALYFEKDDSLFLKEIFQLNTKRNTH
jgi:hypothetical protein|tara:strand:+ start:67 stop:456 length:390 start_codon:yes stop_codon:yes gene_type:complete